MALLLIVGIGLLCMLGGIAAWMFGPQFFLYLALFATIVVVTLVDIAWDTVWQYSLIALGMVLLLVLFHRLLKRWAALPRL